MIPWRKDRLLPPVFLGFPCGSAGQEATWNAGDLGSIPGLGRSSGEGKGYPLQYSGLKNSTNCIVHGVAESDTTEWLSNIHFSHLELVEAIATKTNSQSLLGKTTWLCKVSIVAILYIGKTEASSQYFKNSWQKHFKKKTFQNRFSNRWCFIWIRKTGSFSQRTKVSWSLESE